MHLIDKATALLGYSIVAFLLLVYGPNTATAAPTASFEKVPISWSKVNTIEDVNTALESGSESLGIVVSNPTAEIYASIGSIKRLRGLDLRVTKGGFAEGAEALSGLEELTVLKISLGSNVADEAQIIKVAEKLGSVKLLVIRSESSVEDIDVLLQSLKHLTVVELAISESLTPKVINALSEASILHLELFMSGFTASAEELFDQLAALTTLRTLTLRDLPDNVRAEAFRKLRNSNKLDTLELVGYLSLNASVLVEISKMRGVKALSLRGFTYEKEMAAELSHLDSLEKLTIGEILGTADGENIGNMFEKLKSLKTLVLLGVNRWCPLNEWLAKAITVTDLDVGGETVLNNEALGVIAEMPCLERLSLGVSSTTMDDLRLILSNDRSILKEIDLSSVPVEFDKDEFRRLQKQYPGVSIKTAYN